VSAQATAKGPQPSWFPEKSCREAWGGRDLGRYIPARDAQFEVGVGNVGYKSYQDRLLNENHVDRSSCYKQWTVLVYMAADNDLSPYALWDLHEMEGSYKSGNYAGSTLTSDLLVQADTSGPTGIRRFHIFQNEGPDYKPGKDVEEFKKASPTEIHSPLVSFEKESAPASSAEHRDRMRAFLDWGLRAYPAEHYLVVVWGHGQGWAANLPTTVFAGRFGGFVFSSSDQDYLSIPTLSSILSEVKESTLEGTRPIDIYASDACLMQMAEVAYEISPSVRYIVGSAQVQSYLGLPYRQLMYEINTEGYLPRGEDKGLAPFYLSKQIPIISQRSFDPTRGQQGRADQEASKSFTMSALSAEALQHQLVPALNQLSEQLLGFLQEDPMRALDLRVLMQNAPRFMGGSRDLGAIVGLLKQALAKDAEIRGAWTPAASRSVIAAENLRRAIDLTAVSYSYGQGYAEQAKQLHLLGFRGIGVWLPQSTAEFQTRIDDFSESSLYSSKNLTEAHGAWERLLRAAFTPPSFSKSPAH
jgi:hypothetical protein